jgi:hypothetical protein
VRLPKPVLITVVAAVGLAALAMGLRGPYTELAAAHWRSRLRDVPDSGAEPLLRQVAALGEPGIPVLVEALGSQREAVARAAGEVLFEELRRWQDLSPPEASSRLTILAEALAARVEHFGPTAQSDAARLATRILVWPIEPEGDRRTRVIASCDAVLRTISRARRQLAEGLPPAPGGTVPSSTEAATDRSLPLGEASAPPAIAPEPWTPEASVAELATLPGGALPIDSFNAPAASAGEQDVALRTADRRTEPPRILPDGSAARPLAPSQDSRSPAPAPPRPPGPRNAPVEPPPSAVRPLWREVGIADEGTGSEAAPVGELAGKEAIEVMRRMVSPDAETASAARAELVRRGFGEVHLQLARRLFDPDPAVRKRLAESLPGLGTVDPAPWLLELSRDADAEVRLAAVALLSTTADREILAEVERIARSDPDPRVRQQAERMAGQRGGLRPR